MIGRNLIFQRVGSCLGGKQYSKYSYRYLRTNPIAFQQPPKEPTNQNNKTIDKQSPADDENQPKQQTTTTTKINLYQSQNELSPTRRMDAIMKKKNTAMTDDESTPIGKATAAGKDLLAIGFSAGAVGLLGLVGYYMYTTYVQKKPRDYAYEKLAKIIKDSEDLEDNIGIDFEVQKNKPGTTATGRVESNPIEVLKDEYKTHNLQCLIIQCYVHVKSTGRKGQIQGFFVKKEEESNDEWFPMFAICTLDYESRNYGKRVILEDNRKKLQEDELEIVRANIDSDSELKSIEREERRKTLEFKRQLEAGSTETIDALGLGTFDAPGNKTESKLGKNFAADLKADEVGSQDSKKSESGDGEWSARRKGPRF